MKKKLSMIILCLFFVFSLMMFSKVLRDEKNSDKLKEEENTSNDVIQPEEEYFGDTNSGYTAVLFQDEGHSDITNKIHFGSQAIAMSSDNKYMYVFTNTDLNSSSSSSDDGDDEEEVAGKADQSSTLRVYERKTNKENVYYAFLYKITDLKVGHANSMTCIKSSDKTGEYNVLYIATSLNKSEGPQIVRYRMDDNEHKIKNVNENNTREIDPIYYFEESMIKNLSDNQKNDVRSAVSDAYVDGIAYDKNTKGFYVTVKSKKYDALLYYKNGKFDSYPVIVRTNQTTIVDGVLEITARGESRSLSSTKTDAIGGQKGKVANNQSIYFYDNRIYSVVYLSKANKCTNRSSRGNIEFGTVYTCDKKQSYITIYTIADNGGKVANYERLIQIDPYDLFISTGQISSLPTDLSTIKLNNYVKETQNVFFMNDEMYFSIQKSNNSTYVLKVSEYNLSFNDTNISQKKVYYGEVITEEQLPTPQKEKSFFQSWKNLQTEVNGKTYEELIIKNDVTLDPNWITFVVYDREVEIVVFDLAIKITGKSMTLAELKEKYSDIKEVKTKDGKVVSNNTDIIKTGYQATGNKSYNIIILGDINSDGYINSADYILVRKHILNTGALTDNKLLAADYNQDKKINSQDYVSIRKKILG